MESYNVEIPRSIFDIKDQGPMRTKAIKKCAESIVAMGNEAMSLESQWKAEGERANDLEAHGQETEAAMARARAQRIHVDRCLALQRLANFARLALIEAQGALIISQSTAHTGLDEEDRIKISQVSGAVDLW